MHRARAVSLALLAAVLAGCLSGFTDLTQFSEAPAQCPPGQAVPDKSAEEIGQCRPLAPVATDNATANGTGTDA